MVTEKSPQRVSDAEWELIKWCRLYAQHDAIQDAIVFGMQRQIEQYSRAVKYAKEHGEEADTQDKITLSAYMEIGVLKFRQYFREL